MFFQEKYGIFNIGNKVTAIIFPVKDRNFFISFVERTGECCVKKMWGKLAAEKK